MSTNYCLQGKTMCSQFVTVRFHLIDWGVKLSKCHSPCLSERGDTGERLSKAASKPFVSSLLLSVIAVKFITPLSV